MVLGTICQILNTQNMPPKAKHTERSSCAIGGWVGRQKTFIGRRYQLNVRYTSADRKSAFVPRVPHFPCCSRPEHSTPFYWLCSETRGPSFTTHSAQGCFQPRQRRFCRRRSSAYAGRINAAPKQKQSKEDYHRPRPSG